MPRDRYSLHAQTDVPTKLHVARYTGVFCVYLLGVVLVVRLREVVWGTAATRLFLLLEHLEQLKHTVQPARRVGVARVVGVVSNSSTRCSLHVEWVGLLGPMNSKQLL